MERWVGQVSSLDGAGAGLRIVGFDVSIVMGKVNIDSINEKSLQRRSPFGFDNWSNLRLVSNI
jgi:hypothetical protein